MAHDVFVSHSVKDADVAEAIVARLEAESVRCWVAPRDVVPGADWGEFVDSRRRPISDQQDSIFVSSLVRKGERLTAWPTVYLVVFVDLDENEEIGANEFERIVLEFGK